LIDENYPYRHQIARNGQPTVYGAPIGQYGYETASSQLVAPMANSDYMSYCRPAWTSDYTYFNIYQAFRWVDNWNVNTNFTNQLFLPAIAGAAPQISALAAAAGQSLILSGVIAPDGSLQVDPMFRSNGPPSAPEGTSSYQVVMLDAGRRRLATVQLPLHEVAFEQYETGQMGSGFHVNLPMPDGLAAIQILADGELIFERRTQGAAPLLGSLTRSNGAQGSTQVSWSSAGASSTSPWMYRVLYSGDGGGTWHLLSANTNQPDQLVPAILLEDARNPLLLVQASDGVQTNEQIYHLGQP
jgi:hypothetical protein